MCAFARIHSRVCMAASDIQMQLWVHDVYMNCMHVYMRICTHAHSQENTIYHKRSEHLYVSVSIINDPDIFMYLYLSQTI
jgi:hypothetical protein